MPFPEGGLVYDYRLDDGGVSRTTKGEDEEEEKKPVAKAKVCGTQGMCTCLPSYLNTYTPSHSHILPPSHPPTLTPSHPHTLPPISHQIQWVGWMEGMPAFVVDPSMSFSDIIVPTIDTIRAHFLLELFITNSKPVISRATYSTSNTYIYQCIFFVYVALSTYI